MYKRIFTTLTLGYLLHILLLPALCLLLLSTSYARSSSYSLIEKRQLLQLDPQTRLEQACDIAVMNAIQKQTKLAPDKVLAYAFDDISIQQHQLIAPGAAVRSRNNWYKLSYKCIAQPNHLDIISITFKIGSIVPRTEWEQHYLVP